MRPRSLRARLALLVVVGGVAACGGPSEERAAREAAPLEFDQRERGATAARSLVVIAVGSLRAEALGEGQGEGPGWPHLRALGQRGVLLDQVTAPAPSTVASLTSLLTGRLPEHHGIDDAYLPPHLDGGVITYAEALADRGEHDTLAICEQHAPAGVLQGFHMRREGVPLPEATDVLRAWSRARDGERPHFVIIHARGPGAPFDAPASASSEDAKPDHGVDGDRLDDASFAERYLLDRSTREAWLAQAPQQTRRRIARVLRGGRAWHPTQGLRADLRRAYLHACRRCDAQLHALLETAKAEGLLDDAVLMVTGLHGEGLGEYEVIGNGCSLHEELVHVPTVVVGLPGLDTGRCIPTSVGVVDLLPTCLAAASGDLRAPDGVAGRSMLSAITDGTRGRAVLCMERITSHKAGGLRDALLIGVRTQHESYRIAYDVRAGTVTESLFDRRTDPLERRDRAEEGRLGDQVVSPALAAGIELARDRIWRSVGASAQRTHMGYAAGVATVTSERPAPPHARAP